MLETGRKINDLQVPSDFNRLPIWVIQASLSRIYSFQSLALFTTAFNDLSEANAPGMVFVFHKWAFLSHQNHQVHRGRPLLLYRTWSSHQS